MSTVHAIPSGERTAQFALPHHRRQLIEGSGINPKIVGERGYATVKTKAELKRLGFSAAQQLVPALVVPMYGPTGELATHQIKPDSPRTNGKGKPIKYETPAKSRVRLDVHPSQAHRMKDPTIPIWVTEGVKKADCLVSRGQCVVALQGVWCWQCNGIPLPEWEDIKLYGRTVFVVFDSDVMVKEGVQAALEGLVHFLEGRGATMQVIYLPGTQDGDKQGVDDYLVAGGTVEELKAMAVDGVDGVDGDYGKLPEAAGFPVEALPRPCQRLIEEAAASIGCPPEFVALPMLVTLGSAIGNCRLLRWKWGWEEGAAIYAAVVAEPGEKKTPGAQVALEPVRRLQATLREDFRRAEDEHKRELREYEVDKRDAAKAGLSAPPPPQPPLMERTLVEDTTVEALASILHGTPRGVLAWRDELTGWARAMDQYKLGGRGADRQFWLSAYSGSYASVDRKSQTQPLIIARPFVCVYGGIQPSVLSEIGEGREDGLLDRFLFAFPDPLPSRWTDAEISDEARDGYANLYRKLRDLYMPTDEYGDPDPVRIHLSPAAKDLLRRTINELRSEMYSPGFPTRLKGPWSKLEGYVARICLILTLSRAADSGAPERVEEEDVLAAVALVDYFRGMARRVHVGLHGENPLDQLAADVTKFLKKRGGYYKDEPSTMYAELDSSHKPPRSAELTKNLKAIAAKNPSLGVEFGSFKKGGRARRYVELRLENAVDAVDTVDPDRRSGPGFSEAAMRIL